MDGIKKRILVQRLIMTGGGICFALALLHLFLLPNIQRWSLYLPRLPSQVAGTISIINKGIGLIFLGFGILSIALGRSFLSGRFEAWNFGFFVGVILLYRAIAQLLYLGTDWLSIAIFLILLFTSLLYLIPLLLFYKEFLPH